MALILLFALWLRAGDLFDWLREPERAFFNGRPVLINFDGYYYLSQARDLLHGGYGRTDDLRGIPEPPPRPMPPPLLAVTAALLTRATSIPLEWVGALLPPLLGLSLAWPLYLIGRRFGGRLMALCAVWFGLSAEYYVYRSHLGWFDTDCLNASLVLLVSYFFMRFGMLTEFRRFRFLAAGLICSAVFVLWWDQAWSVVMLICLGPLLLAVALGHRPRGGQLWVLLAVVVLCLALLSVWRGPQVFKTPFQSVVEQWAYLNQQASGGFPGVGRSVLEQDRGTLAESARRTSGNLPAFLAGFFGLALFGWHRPRRAAVLIVPLALGLLSLSSPGVS